MLKRKALKKMFLTTFTCFIIMTLYLIPTKINDNYINPKIDVIYTSTVYNSEIYLLGENNYLVKTNLMLKSSKLKDKIKEIINCLKVESDYKKPIGLKGIIPKNTKINKIEINDHKIRIDFSKDINNIEEKLKERLLESIVYSLTSIEEIYEIKLSVDDNYIKLNNKVLDEYLNRDFGINKVYDITNRNGIKKVILYYTENIGNNNYYVPVTKYLNDDRNKINIIIDSLSSDYIHEENLSSYLKNDILLLDYKTNNKTMEINFNKEIFPADKLLETVEYTFSNTIFDNYDVNKLIVKVNGKPDKTIEKCKFTNTCNEE